MGIGLSVALGFFVDVIGRVQSMMRNDRETEENPFKPPTPPLYSPTDPPMTVKIFFPAASGEPLLTAEDSSIFKSGELTNRAKQVLEKLQEGPKTEGMFPAMPRDTKVEDVFISEEGTAFINFSKTIETNHPGGVLSEVATIYSVVNSLTYNLPEITGVKILIGGIEKETLAGHSLLLLPLEMDLSITNVAPPADRTASLSK